MPQVRFHILGRAVPSLGPVYEWPTQVFPLGPEGAVGCTIVRPAVGIDRDQPRRDMWTRWAGGMEIGRDFKANPDNLAFEPPCGDGVAESHPVVARIFGSVAEFLQSRSERLRTEDSHVRKPASGRLVW